MSARRKHRKPAHKPARQHVDGLPYTEEERQIFEFCDHSPQCACKPGKANCRRIDPMMVMEVLEESGEELNENLKLLGAGIPVEHQAKAITPALKMLEKAVRKAFGRRKSDGSITPLADWDEKHGMTRGECVKLFYSFMAYTNRCKKKVDALRTSLGSGPPFSFPSKISATKPSSASNSTSAGSTPINPPPSEPASDSASAATQETPTGTTSPAT